MTFRIKERDAGGFMVAEYRCPECGDFEATVAKPVPDHHDCPICGAESDWVISAPKPKVLSVAAYAAVRGGDMKERPPGMLDTRPLAEGMPMSEWKKLQAKHQQERRHQQLIEKGLKSRRIQSP